MRHTIPLVIALAAALAAQPPAPEPAVTISVPAFPNKTCPIMGKPASSALFVDTDRGRIYVCCTPCNKKVLADVDTAYRAAYPISTAVANEACPVTGEKLPEKPKTILLQGKEIGICCETCRKEATENAQVVLAKTLEPGLVDLANEKCPISGLPTVKNHFLVIDRKIVRLSSSECIEWALKDPALVLSKIAEMRGPEKKPDDARPKPPAKDPGQGGSGS